MAVTKIHAIKSTLSKAVAYIENPGKTADQVLITGYGTDPHTAPLEFEMTRQLAKEKKGNFEKTGKANNLAYHMIQSFSPTDQLTPKKAHELGRAWADEVLKGKHQYILATHLDKGHLHNHVIFNATSFKDFTKFRSVPYKTAAMLRAVSDKLCQIHNLEIIKHPRGIGKSYHELQHAKHGTSWKAQIAAAIDQATSQTTTYSEFKQYLNQTGVEVKEGKRLSFRLKANKQGRFCRGDRIGSDYSREGIEQRLAMTRELGTNPPYFKQLEWQAKQLGIPSNNPTLTHTLTTIKKENITSEKNLRQTITDLQNHNQKLDTQILKLNTQIKRDQLIAHQLTIYNQNKPIFKELQRKLFFNRKRFEQKHQSELAAYYNAQKNLQKLNFAFTHDDDKQKVTATLHHHTQQLNRLTRQYSTHNYRFLGLNQALSVVDAMATGEIEEVMKRGLTLGLKLGVGVLVR